MQIVLFLVKLKKSIENLHNFITQIIQNTKFIDIIFSWDIQLQFNIEFTGEHTVMYPICY